MIPGDHERRDTDGYPRDFYETYTGFLGYYSTSIGNILLLHAGSYSVFKNQDWSDDEFNWWEQNVISNQDKIIITFTHPPVYDTVLHSTDSFWYKEDHLTQINEVLQNYQIDIWFNGHTHHTFSPIVEKWGTYFVDAGSTSGGGGYKSGVLPYPGINEG